MQTSSKLTDSHVYTELQACLVSIDFLCDNEPVICNYRTIAPTPIPPMGIVGILTSVFKALK